MKKIMLAALALLTVSGPVTAQGGQSAPEQPGAQEEKASVLSGWKDKLSDIAGTARDKIVDLSQSARELLASPEASGQTESKDDEFFQKTWKKFTGVANEAINLAAGDNPRQKTVLEFVTLQDPKYVRLLKEARAILSKSEVEERFEAIEKLRAKNRELQAEMTKLRQQRVGAPTSTLNPLSSTRSGIDKKLGELSAEIVANDHMIGELKNMILLILGKDGIVMSPQELDYFVVSAEGGELMQLITIADNMKKMQKVIEEELARDPANVELARIYTGMYLVSLDAYAQAHDSAMGNISAYRQKLAAIQQEARNNRDVARDLQGKVGAEDAAHVENNIRMNDRTLEVARMYDSILDRRTENLAVSGAKARQKVEVARNTYKSIANGAALISLVNDGSREYALLVNFEMPELKNLYDTAIMSAFTDISDKIKAEK